MTYPIRIAVIDDDPAVLDAARFCSNCWVMPLGQRMTGLELAEELRRRGIAIPTMLVSGYDLSDRDKGEEAEDRKGPRKTALRG